MDAIDCNGSIIINGGTIISVARTSGVDVSDIIESTIPLLVINTKYGEGTINIGNITYSPSVTGYRYLVIASEDLTQGNYVLYYGNNTIELNIKNGVNRIG